MKEKSMYMEGTWTGLYLTHNNFCSINYKSSLVKILFNRIRILCSNNEFNKELATLEKRLIKNIYPKKFIAKYRQKDSKDGEQSRQH